MIVDILDAIYIGYDGLIRSINFKTLEFIIIEISARNKSDGNWINVQFIMKDVLEFCIKQKFKYEYTVLSDGIFYKKINEIHYIDFSPILEENNSEEDFRMSSFYFASSSIECRKIPYREKTYLFGEEPIC